MRPAFVALLGLALSACGGHGGATATASPGHVVVLVSGRDDHGALQLPHVPLYAKPHGTEVAGSMPDGAFAEVLEVDGTWLRIRSVADPSVSGWIDDFRLRNRAVLHNVQQVRFLQARIGPDDTVEIEVQGLESDAPTLWVGEDHLDEVGADIAPHDH